MVVPCTWMVSHMLLEKRMSHPSAARWLRYHSTLLGTPNMTVKHCKTLNPAMMMGSLIVTMLILLTSNPLLNWVRPPFLRCLSSTRMAQLSEARLVNLRLVILWCLILMLEPVHLAGQLSAQCVEIIVASGGR